MPEDESAPAENTEGTGEIDFAGLPTPEVEEASNPVEETGGNPAWGSVLEKIPAPFHNVVRPELENWDRGVQQRLESVRQEVRQQYEPYQQFLDNSIDANELQTAYQLVQQLTSNPQQFYQTLGQALGISEEEAEEVVEELEQEQGQEDPRIAELMQNQRQMMEYFQHQQQEQQRQAQIEQRQAQIEQMNQQIDDEFAQIEQKHGKLSPEVKGRVLEQAFLMNQRTGKVVKIADAFDELTKFVAKVRNAPGPGDKAPPAMPTGGGLPSRSTTGNKSVGQLSPAERRALAEQIIQQSQAR